MKPTFFPTMAPPAAATDREANAPQATRRGVALVGGIAGQVAEEGAALPSLVNPAYRTVTPPLSSISDGEHIQSYRDFIGVLGPVGITIPGRAIAGTGRTTKETCGRIKAWAGCSKDKGHKATPLKENCDHIECPECWTGTVSKQSRRDSERLRGYIRTARPEYGTWFSGEEEDKCFTYCDSQWYEFQDDPDFQPFWSVGHKENAQHLRHIILSAAPGDITPDMPTPVIHAIGKMWARFVGIKGGMMVFHPWRILPSVKTRLQARIQREKRDTEEEYEKKHWQAIRENALGLESWQAYVYWSPHFHIVGFGYICDSPNFYRLTGWTVKQIRNISQKKSWNGQKMKDDVAAVIYYVMSHCNVEWGRKSVIWLGCCTPTNMKRLQEKPEVVLYKKECEECKAQQIVYQDDGKDDLGEPSRGQDGKYQWLFYKEKLYRYHIVTRKEKEEQREKRRAERLKNAG